MYRSWSAPLPQGDSSEEMALVFDQSRKHRLLVLPPLFDEHNKVRHQIAEVMRRLDLRGIDCFLPDFPGCNESTEPLAKQTLSNWQVGAGKATEQYSITHLLAIRGGALLAPDHLPTYVYAPAKGRQLLNALLRARVIASKEQGNAENRDELLSKAKTEGITLAGWTLGAQMVAELEQAEPRLASDARIIEQSEVGGTPLWLRAEPGDDPEQADGLAAAISIGLMGE